MGQPATGQHASLLSGRLTPAPPSVHLSRERLRITRAGSVKTETTVRRTIRRTFGEHIAPRSLSIEYVLGPRLSKQIPV